MITILGLLLIGVLINTNKRCPATILAANRMANVKGRMQELISSIITIKGINKVGVPLGTKWAKNFLMFWAALKEIYPNQKLSPNGRVKAICLVLVKTYGESPIKLFKRIYIKIVTKVRFTEEEYPLKFWSEISLLRNLIILHIIKKGFLFKAQNIEGKINTLKKEIQFILSPKAPVEGSKEENRFEIFLENNWN